MMDSYNSLNWVVFTMHSRSPIKAVITIVTGQLIKPIYHTYKKIAIELHCFNK